MSTVPANGPKAVIDRRCSSRGALSRPAEVAAPVAAALPVLTGAAQPDGLDGVGHDLSLCVGRAVTTPDVCEEVAADVDVGLPCYARGIRADRGRCAPAGRRAATGVCGNRRSTCSIAPRAHGVSERTRHQAPSAAARSARWRRSASPAEDGERADHRRLHRSARRPRHRGRPGPRPLAPASMHMATGDPSSARSRRSAAGRAGARGRRRRCGRTPAVHHRHALDGDAAQSLVAPPLTKAWDITTDGRPRASRSARSGPSRPPGPRRGSARPRRGAQRRWTARGRRG